MFDFAQANIPVNLFIFAVTAVIVWLAMLVCHFAELIVLFFLR